MGEYDREKWRASAEKLWDATRKTLQTAGFRAGQYKEVAQKKFDLNILHKNIAALHAEIGRIVDDCRDASDLDILARDDIRQILRRLDGYKIAAAELAEEIERIKAKMPADAGANEDDG